MVKENPSPLLVKDSLGTVWQEEQATPHLCCVRKFNKVINSPEAVEFCFCLLLETEEEG